MIPQLTEDYSLTETQIARFRHDGLIKLENVVTGETLDSFRTIVAAAVNQEKSLDILDRRASAPLQTRGA